MDIQSLYKTALQHHQNNAFALAEASYKQIISIEPKHADATHYLGVIYHQTGRHEEAIKYIQQALLIDPNNSNFLSNFGAALIAAGQLHDAVKSYQKALALNPNDSDILFNLSNVFYDLTEYGEAADCYRKLQKIYPNDADIKANLSAILQSAGSANQQSGLYEQATLNYQEAALLTPQDATIYYNLANAQRELGKARDAAINYQKTIALNPGDADAYNNLGNVQRELGQLQEAINSYRTALKLNPGLYHAKVHLVHQKQHVCDWENLTEEIAEIRQWVKEKPQAQVSPFAFLSMPETNSEEQRQCANNWLGNRYKEPFSQGERLNFKYAYQHSRIRIGYLSADFRLHPLSSLITELIEVHDRKHFEIYAYSYGINDETLERKRLEHAFDHFVDIRANSQVEAAQQINNDEIDILVDLTGFTQTSRTAIVAMRPTKLSISWLGFPGTMGAFHEQPLFDYILSDAFITPKTAAKDYSEKLVLLPDCYQPNDRKRPVGDAKTREAYGLKSDAFVFCCFNQTFKILPAVFDVWMRLLKAKPNASLWLLECNALAKQNLLKEAKARGVDSEQLVFAPRVSMAEHLARHIHADLFLDTLPYNAHTTTSDALWMGLPVLTCAGNTFASRVAGSLLSAAGLPELITKDLNEYEAKAMDLANSPEKLNGLKHRLLDRREQLALFDMEKFAKNLERIYTDLYQSNN
jgi:predicted O-linked N-acetylglucosamine transferase (SPINDLY family)